MIRIGITGARPPSEIVSEKERLVWPVMLQYLEEIIADLTDDAIIVHGDARGIDRTAKQLALARGLKEEAHPADWVRYGKSAGIRRNVYVTTCAVVHAFPAPWSVGTYDAMGQAYKAGVLYIDHSERYM